MEPFSIYCTTCGRRLKVRDPALVGQILACPKCQGMVLIAPPDEISAAAPPAQPPVAMGDSLVDSEAVTREGIDSPDAGLDWPDRPPAVKWVQGPTQDHEFDAASAPTPPPRVSSASDTDLPQTPLWQSESSARARQIAGVAALAILALACSGAVFWLVVDRWRTTRDVADGSHAARPAESESPPPSDAAIEDPQQQPDQPTEEGAAESAATPQGSSPARPTSTAAEIDAASQGDPRASGREAELNPPPEIGSGELSSGEGPGDFAPAPLFPEDLSSEGTGSEGTGPQGKGPLDTDEASSETTARELPAGLSQYMPMIGLGSTDASLPPNPLPAPPTMDDLRIAAPDAAAPETKYPPPSDPVDVAARMKVRVLGFEAEDRPLDQVIRVISQAAGVPIEIDLLALDIAGIRPDTAISVRVDNVRVEGLDAGTLLRGVLALAGCRVAHVEAGIVRVAPAEAKFAEGITALLAAGDLGADLPLPEDDFVRWIGSSEPAAKVQWEPAAGRVTVEGSESARVRAAMLIEGLRVARGLASPLDKAFRERWIVDLSAGDALAARAAEWSPVPATDVRLDFDQPLAIEMIVGRLARESDAALVTDWTSAWTHGLTPEETSLPWLKGRQAPEVIREILDPYVVNVYAAGSGAWWLGTRETYDRMPVLAVLPAVDSPPDEVLGRVAAAAGMDVGQVPAVIDPISAKLVVYLPRYIVRDLPTVLVGR